MNPSAKGATGVENVRSQSDSQGARSGLQPAGPSLQNPGMWSLTDANSSWGKNSHQAFNHPHPHLYSVDEREGEREQPTIKPAYIKMFMGYEIFCTLGFICSSAIPQVKLLIVWLAKKKKKQNKTNEIETKTTRQILPAGEGSGGCFWCWGGEGVLSSGKSMRLQLCTRNMHHPLI